MGLEVQGNGAKPVRKAIRKIRDKVPQSLKLRVWQRTMKAVLARRVEGKPQGLFNSIEIETRTKCNSACSFCGASILHDKRKDLLMPDELFAKIIAELKNLCFSGTVRLYVNNEPLLDKRMPEMIRAIAQQLPQATIEIQTNGLSLNPRIGEEILQAGLHTLIINNYSDEGEVHKGVQKFLDETAPNYQDREIKVHMRRLNQSLQNRGGTAPNAEALREPLKLSCILPFDEIVVTANGKVSICCQDLEFENAVGNLNETTLGEIWFGPEMTRLRQDLKNSDRSQNPLCAGCDYRGFREDHISEAQSKVNRLVGAYWDVD